MILWTDEATFTRRGIFNSHNSHVWAHNNPHTTRQRNFQQQTAGAYSTSGNKKKFLYRICLYIYIYFDLRHFCHSSFVMM
ncbi:hypothetical protein X777_07058 [Ooceraea biroi]|uniref:PiggyBac transposable element-derived protein domain-containing protein n=1 Tax=Ooceraea biroi TaxID=2015173 RepID=A0A026W9A6_OOCBI|nr:hypothetical protein X777_07058 [Ooceraea biroi]